MTAGICTQYGRPPIAASRGDDREKTKLYQHTVQEQEDEIVRPTPLKNLLLPMQGEQALERHEDKTGDENNFQTKQVHVSNPKRQTYQSR
jgi:hypothetical protein